MKSKESLRDVQDTIKETSTCTFRGLEGEERKRQKAYLKKLWPNLPKSGKTVDIQIQEAKCTPIRMDGDTL